MAKRDYTANQIIRLDGNKCFMEVLNDAFPIGKVHFGFYTYDVGKAEGSRITNNIQIYLSIPEFLALAQEISSGRLCQKAQVSLEQSKQSRSFPCPVFESLGGTSAERLRKMGQSRPDNMGISRQFRIIPGTKKPFLLNAESGPGQADQKGLIVPKYKTGQGEQKVMVPADYNMMLRMAETVRIHIQAYFSACYLSNPIAAQSCKASEQEPGDSKLGDGEERRSIRPYSRETYDLSAV